MFILTAGGVTSKLPGFSSLLSISLQLPNKICLHLFLIFSNSSFSSIWTTSSSLEKVKKILCLASVPEDGDAPDGKSIFNGSSYLALSESDDYQMNGTYSLAKNCLE